MPVGPLVEIQEAFLQGRFEVTAHFLEEMRENGKVHS